jgi:hypothetical protein
MTDKVAKRPRRSKRALRAWAWIAGALAFLAPWAAFGVSPKPATAVAESASKPRHVIIVRRITRRVVVQDQPATQPVQYVYVGGGSSGSSSSSGSSGSGPVAAPPPPTTTTSGS